MMGSLPSPSEYYRRTEGLLSEAIHGRGVLAVGCGAGSYMLEKLARMGPGLIRLVDPDIVEPVNLTRTAFVMPDLGRLKVEALAIRIADVNPFVRIETIAADLCALPEGELSRLLRGVDLIIAGTDHFPAQALLNRLSQANRTPAVFIGIHEAARGGRVIWSVPGETACYRCVAHERFEAFEANGLAMTDLAGQHGLLADIQLIDMIALKVALAILDRDSRSACGRFYDGMRGRTEVIIRTSPEYGFGRLLWNALLSDLPAEPKAYASELEQEAFFAMDSVWLRTAPRPGCPDCNR